MGKDLRQIIKVLEENWIDSTEEIVNMTPEQCKALNVPIGLINKIKIEIANRSANPATTI